MLLQPYNLLPHCHILATTLPLPCHNLTSMQQPCNFCMGNQLSIADVPSSTARFLDVLFNSVRWFPVVANFQKHFIKSLSIIIVTVKQNLDIYLFGNGSGKLIVFKILELDICYIRTIYPHPKSASGYNASNDSSISK